MRMAQRDSFTLMALLKAFTSVAGGTDLYRHRFTIVLVPFEINRTLFAGESISAPFATWSDLTVFRGHSLCTKPGKSASTAVTTNATEACIVLHQELMTE